MSTEVRRIDIIKDLLKSSRLASPRVVEGVLAFDDCAVIRLNDELDLIVGSDFVRGAGFYLFQLGLLNWFDVGFYLVGANASDLAAMGAEPLGIVAVCRYTSEMTDDQFRLLMAGIVAACEQFEIPLVGGDTGGYESSVISAAAFGTCRAGKALLRRGGAVGDRLFLTGDVGLAAAALAYFLRAKPEGMKLRPAEEEQLLSRWKRVSPALKQGSVLRALELSRCAIDTSDGLKAGCRQLAEASGVDVHIDVARVPIQPLVFAVADFLGVDAFALAVGDSVDFRLLFSSADSQAHQVIGEFHAREWEIHEIGSLVEPIGEPRVLCRKDGKTFEMPGIEWTQSDELTIDSLRGAS